MKPNINPLTSQTVLTYMHSAMGSCYVTVGSVYLCQKQKALWNVLPLPPYHMTIIKHSRHVLKQSTHVLWRLEAQWIKQRSVYRQKYQRDTASGLCVRVCRQRDGFMSHLTKLRSLRDISSSAQLEIITHTHILYIYVCVWVRGWWKCTFLSKRWYNRYFHKLSHVRVK